MIIGFDELADANGVMNTFKNFDYVRLPALVKLLFLWEDWVSHVPLLL